MVGSGEVGEVGAELGQVVRPEERGGWGHNNQVKFSPAKPNQAKLIQAKSSQVVSSQEEVGTRRVRTAAHSSSSACPPCRLAAWFIAPMRASIMPSGLSEVSSPVHQVKKSQVGWSEVLGICACIHAPQTPACVIPAPTHAPPAHAHTHAQPPARVHLHTPTCTPRLHMHARALLPAHVCMLMCACSCVHAHVCMRM